jgi:hypothetical protein
MTDFPDDFAGSYPDGTYVISPKIVSQATARRFVGQHGRGYMSIGIVDDDGNPIDPDPGTLRLKVYLNTLDGTATDPKGNLVADVTDTSGIIRDDVGKFHYDVGPTLTAQRGTLTAEWEYGATTQQFTFVDNMQILDQMPIYDNLAEDTKLIVEQSSWFFADLFDSTAGGPWLQENFQTHFNYERIAALMAHATTKFNMLGFPVTDYGVAVNENAIPDNYKGIIVWGTKLEIIRHLIRSYTEQPQFMNMATTYTDRRDYSARWQAVLDEEKPEFEKAVKMSKRALLNLGRGSLLVSGGIYGGNAGRSFFVAGMYSAQVRAFRFYPASPSSMWSAQAFGRP